MKRGDNMCETPTRLCTICKWAEYDYVDAYGGGFWGVCGCNLPPNSPITDDDLSEEEIKRIENMVDEWDDEWGEEKDCPFFEFEAEEVDPDYERYLDVEISEDDFN